MPKRAWYLADVDIDAYLAIEPRPDVAAVLDELTNRFGARAGFSAAHTATAISVALLMAQHLGDSVTHPSNFGDPGDLDRLITGLNLLTAQLAQTMQRLAYHVDRNDLPCLYNAPAGLTADVTDSLARAGSNGELVAGHLKDAQLTLWPLASQPTTA